MGDLKRIALAAEDLVQHWEARYAAMLGKAMVVCMSRRICVELHKAIQNLRPVWHHDDDDKGVMKIVMSGSASNKVEWQQHIRSKARREELAKAFKNPKKPFRIVIVRDMWLTGFDAPSLHTMYVDKPMRGHGLMQAIARVNRVFKDKPGGLVVDYLVQSRSFAEMLEATIRKYQNRTIEAAQVIAELIELAKQMREGHKRGEQLGLSDDEVAFYDAPEVNNSAVKVLGEPTLKAIARELVSHVRKNVTIDWTLRESAQAQIRVMVRRILRKYGYPPDKQEKATQTVLEQAKLLCAEWAG